MLDVLQAVDRVRQKARQRQDALSQHYLTPATDPPLGGLGMCFNNATLCLELLSYYHKLWAKLSAAEFPDPEQTRQQNAERVTLVTKSMFVLSMSGFEYSAKQALATDPGRLPLRRGRVYLSGIMRASAKVGLISAQTDTLWRGATEVRNSLVHNNGIAEKTITYVYPGTTAVLKAGRMSQGNLLFFAALTEWMVNAFADWCEKLLGQPGRTPSSRHGSCS